MANLQEIKRSLGVETLGFNKVVTEAGEVTEWFKDWNNDSRTAILIHKDTLTAIKADMKISTLGINTQTKTGAKGDYVAKTICIYKPADEVL
jgi:hypothetical protein